MEVQWFSKNLRGVVTLYETNITLNTIASSYFTDAYSTLIGYNKKEDNLIIKKITKEEADSGVYGKIDMHPIILKPSYGRINGKNIIRNICTFKKLDFTQTTMHKYECYFDESSKSLIINMKEEVK